jgi:predicted RNase H-like HicB family nuclease
MADKGYPAVFYDQGGSIGVGFPDLPGCVTVGRDIKEAVLRAEEVLAFHLHTMIEDGDDLPMPTRPLEAVEIDPEGVVVGKLWIEPRLSRAVRVTITMDESLLARIDQAARLMGTSRSGFLAQGARQLIEA